MSKRKNALQLVLACLVAFFMLAACGEKEVTENSLTGQWVPADDKNAGFGNIKTVEEVTFTVRAPDKSIQAKIAGRYEVEDTGGGAARVTSQGRMGGYTYTAWDAAKRTFTLKDDGGSITFLSYDSVKLSLDGSEITLKRK